MNLILKNATYLFISNVILRLFSALTTIMVARYLGANDYGILSLALAISNIAGYFTDMGLSHHSHQVKNLGLCTPLKTWYPF
ncbi:oligosaccharide flippase family protein [Anoxybacillus flavithermus]|uniref:oligosaccharide flippase family protein n=1 Tax=Anoxybacillus flavithermus TaxID=33934 RepID=UPI0007DA150A|nr:oligosaccharide flippase family protein [Anoxybacillus flavithermus]